jgi:hypothetical protein
MNIKHINAIIEPQKQLLLRHSLYDKVQTIENLHCFLENHVYAVWDFMSLLKALQKTLTCTSIPWYPTKNQQTRYLINEIVLAEESDLNSKGRRQSHYEMYIDAMVSCGANTTVINNFTGNIHSSTSIFDAIKNSNLDPKIQAFLEFTFTVIAGGKAHEIAAAFTFGREDLIPNMFTEILKSFQKNFPQTDLSQLIYYFERHIEIDADEHGPMAMQMMDELCGDDAQKWLEVENISVTALKRRIGMWDAIEEQIMAKMQYA